MVPQDAAKLLLDRVSLQLQNGNNFVLNNMLLIMDHYGTDTTKMISLEIRSKLSSLKCHVGNTEKGNITVILPPSATFI